MSIVYCFKICVKKPIRNLLKYTKIYFKLNIIFTFIYLNAFYKILTLNYLKNN